MSEQALSSEQWELRRPFSVKLLVVVLAVVIVLAASAQRTQIYQGFYLTWEGLAYALGLSRTAEISGGSKLLQSAFPFTISQSTAVSRIPDFDAERLPWFSYLAVEPVLRYDIDSGSMVVVEQQQVVVAPFGYLTTVIGMMIETLEIALWGTILAFGLAVPLAYFGTKAYSFNGVTYSIARAMCSFCRALPELILALIFVVMFGFGPLPGVLALGIHCCGFLGKFFADEIENVDHGPQDALRSTGANRLKVMWYAVLPQSAPQFVAYLQDILERNVRSAAVLGIVGAGGIGSELKGKIDMSDYSHVSTILLIILITVFSLEQISHWLRSRLIGT